MSVPQQTFNDFLSNIRLTEAQRQAARNAHTELRERLEQDPVLSSHILVSFLQGSYRRHTAIKPNGGESSDIDVVVVTDFQESRYSPRQALDAFIPFLEANYPGRHHPNGRSWGIEFQGVDLDLVVTAAPSESALKTAKSVSESPFQAALGPSVSDETLKSIAGDWANGLLNNGPLRIPDREVNLWSDTDPISQWLWTLQKNASTQGHYVNVVKAIKWWQRVNAARIARPKGYPLEHIVGNCCADAIASVEEGVTLALEGVRATYEEDFAARRVPILLDRGVNQDVFARLSWPDFEAFYMEVESAAGTARAAFNSADSCQSHRLWRELFGEAFPELPEGCGKVDGVSEKGFSGRDVRTKIGAGRYA